MHPKGSLIPRLFPPPVFDRLQYANTEGEGLGIWSCAVTSGRQKVDTQGAVPVEESQSPFLYYMVRGLEARALARQCQYHPSYVAPGTVRHEKAITTVGHRPPCVLAVYIYLT